MRSLKSWWLPLLALALALAVAVPAPLQAQDDQQGAELQQMWEDALQLLQDRKLDEAAGKFLELAERLPQVPEAAEIRGACYYNAACARSLQDKKQLGVQAFAQAVRAGFRDMGHIDTDTDLDNIRKEPMFVALMELVRGKKFDELDKLDVDAWVKRYYSGGGFAPPVGPAPTPGPEPKLNDEQRAKLDALRRELYGQIDKELDAARARLRELVDRELDAIAGNPGSNTPAPGGKPHLGLALKPIDNSLREFMGIPANEGVLVSEVDAAGPAGKAGLLKLDVLLRADGKAIGKTDDLDAVLAGKKSGDAVTLTVLRSGQRLDIKVVLGTARPAAGNENGNGSTTPPANRVPALEGGYIGLSAAHDESGLHVRNVVPDSPAAQAGLQVNDTIVKVAGMEMLSNADLRTALGKHFVGDTLEIVIRRNGAQQTLKLTIGKRP